MLHDLLPKTLEGALVVLGGWLGLIWSATLQSVAPLVWWYAIFVLTDIITGVWAGIKTNGFSSSTLSAGLLKKGIVHNLERVGYGDALPPALRRIFLTLEDRLTHAVDKKLDDMGLDDKEDKK